MAISDGNSVSDMTIIFVMISSSGISHLYEIDHVFLLQFFKLIEVYDTAGNVGGGVFFPGGAELVVIAEPDARQAGLLRRQVRHPDLPGLDDRAFCGLVLRQQVAHGHGLSPE